MLKAAKTVTGESRDINAAVFMLTTLTDQQLKKDIQDQAKGEGVNIVTSQDADVTATDVSSQIAQIVAAKPDIVLISATGPGFVTALKGARAAGLQAPFVWTDGTSNLKSVAEIKDPGVYALTVHELVDPSSASDVAKDYIDAITPSIQGTVDAVNLNSGENVVGYATARAFGEATKKCGDGCTGENLRQQLEKTSVEMKELVPTFAYGGSDHYPYANWLLQQVQGTVYKKIDSFEADASK
jgi:ABC-type branched-subunit amino acid transport system substrate-binding protein